MLLGACCAASPRVRGVDAEVGPILLAEAAQVHEATGHRDLAHREEVSTLEQGPSALEASLAQEVAHGELRALAPDVLGPGGLLSERYRDGGPLQVGPAVTFGIGVAL